MVGEDKGREYKGREHEGREGKEKKGWRGWGRQQTRKYKMESKTMGRKMKEKNARKVKEERREMENEKVEGCDSAAEPMSGKEEEWKREKKECQHVTPQA